MNNIKQYLFGDFRHDEFIKTKKIFRGINTKSKILDVGCGYGKKIIFLKEIGFSDILGVDINTSLVELNKKNGLNVVSIEDFNKIEDKFDLIIMSHLIEHFQYDSLKIFMENYLSRLKVGGHLLIITPMLDTTFYTNFDHVKPYLPDGIRTVFENDMSQVQFQSSQRLKLIDLYFRKSPFLLKFFKSNYIGKQKLIIKIINYIYLITFNLSGRLLGKKNGWIGLYKKIGEI